MAVVRHFALNLVRQADDKRAIKRRRKVASWNPHYLYQMLQLTPVNPDSLPWQVSIDKAAGPHGPTAFLFQQAEETET
jgi:hypothetical protein